MKKSARCPKCDGTKIGRLARVPDTSNGIPRERVLGYELHQGILIDEHTFAGEVEAYVCTECGYFEEYVGHARVVPWEKLHGFTWHSRESAPFR